MSLVSRHRSSACLGELDILVASILHEAPDFSLTSTKQIQSSISTVFNTRPAYRHEICERLDLKIQEVPSRVGDQCLTSQFLE